MKKCLMAIIVLTLMFCSISYPVAADEVNVILDGELIDFDVPAQIFNGRTMVPVRKIFEILGMTVNWDEQTKTVFAYKSGVFVELPIDSYVVHRNTVEQIIDVPAQIINDRTLVPIRIVSEYTGADVDWNESTKTVYINSTNNIQYIDWNDAYYYYGESINGRASGYGILYYKSDDSIAQLGKYVDSKIVVGTDYFNNGDVYIGNYENGYMSYGTYNYHDGASYTGEFKNSKKHGEGTYYYANGNFLQGKWEDDLLNGYCIFYDATEDVQLQGNYLNGKRDGVFLVDDFFLGKSYYIEYENGEIYDAQKEAENIYREKMATWEKDYNEFVNWYEDEVNKLYDYVTNGNPYETDWAKSIYEQYGVYKQSSAATNGGNIDSFAAANAMRQRQALKANADKAIEEYNKTYISNWKKLIEDTYNEKKEVLDRRYEAIQQEYNNAIK